MNKNEVIEFFDNCAEWWDSKTVRNEHIIKKILDNSGVVKGVDVLDVACGTGVLFSDYLNRRINSLTAIDISPKMVEIARTKFPKVDVICGDVETEKFNKKFDVVMVYNAFPHFINPSNMIKVLAQLTAPKGKLSIAHSMSRCALIEHHKNVKNVSLILPTAKRMTEMFSKWFDIETVVSNDMMYQVVGSRKE